MDKKTTGDKNRLITEIQNGRTFTWTSISCDKSEIIMRIQNETCSHTRQSHMVKPDKG